MCRRGGGDLRVRRPTCEATRKPEAELVVTEAGRDPPADEWHLALREEGGRADERCDYRHRRKDLVLLRELLALVAILAQVATVVAEPDGVDLAAEHAGLVVLTLEARLGADR